MHKLLLFAKRRTCQSCFTYQCVTRRRMKTRRCLTKFREEKYEGSLQQSFFPLLKRGELWRMAFRYSSDDSRCHELWKKKKEKEESLAVSILKKEDEEEKKGANDNKGTRRSRHDFHSIMLLFCLRRGGRKVNKALDIHPLAHWNRSRILLIKK